MKKLLILVLCLFSFNIALALPEIPAKQLPQFKIDAQAVLDTINSKPTCIGNKTYKKYITDLYNEDYKLYQDFKNNPTNIKKVKYSDKLMDDSSSLQEMASYLLEDSEILFKRYKSAINMANVCAIESCNTFDFLYLLFKKYNIVGYQEFKELLSLIEKTQNDILDWKEEIDHF